MELALQVELLRFTINISIMLGGEFMAWQNTIGMPLQENVPLLSDMTRGNIN
jgi:hypothetical protein